MGAPEITSKQLEAALATCLNSGDDVVLHSSLKNLGRFIDGVDSIVDLLLSAVGPSGTITMISHTTRSFSSQGRFSLEQPSEAGILSETFRQRAGVLRSKVPMVSFCSYGARAEEYTQQYHSHLDKDAPLTRLLSNRGKMLLFGVDYSRCTLFHLSEERAATEYNAYKNFEGLFVDNDGATSPISQRYFVRKDMTTKKDGNNIKQIFESTYRVSTATLGMGELKSFDAVEFDRCCQGAVSNDPHFFLVKS